MAMKRKKVEIPKEKFEELDAMIEGISWKKKKYADEVGLSREIIYQECWLRTMELIGEWHNEVPPLPLIATCCYNHIVDLGRKQFVRVGQIPVDPDEFDISNTEIGDNHWGNMRDCSWNRNLKIGTDTSRLYIEEIENLFEEGSKERAYIRLVEIYAGVKEVPAKEFDSLFDMSTSMRNEVAWNLGYVNASSNGFRGVEWRVRQAILRYQGLLA